MGEGSKNLVLLTCSNLSDQQLHTDCCKMLYMNRIVTTNQKPTIDAYKKRERTLSITLKKLINPQWKSAKRRRKEQRTIKQPENK